MTIAGAAGALSDPVLEKAVAAGTVGGENAVPLRAPAKFAGGGPTGLPT